MSAEHWRLWDLLECRAERWAGRPFLTDDNGRSLTFGELRDAGLGAAARFAALGLGPGDTVSWQLPTGVDAIVVAVALARLGVIQNPLLPILRQRELRFITAQAGSRMLIVPGTWRGTDYLALAEDVAATVAGLEVFDLSRVPVLEGAPEPGGGDLPSLPPHDARDPDEDWWLFYTSGTTGDPKGVRHNERTLAATASGISGRYEIDGDDAVGIVFPVSHIGGVMWIYAGLMTGCRLLLTATFNPATVDFLRRQEVTVAGTGTPFLLAYLERQRALPVGERLFPAVRAFTSGAAPRPAHLHDELVAEFGGTGVLASWGLTEAPILTGVSPHAEDRTKALTEGWPLPGVDLRVVRADGSLAAAGEEGELRAKAPQMMLGYVDASLDAAAFDEHGYLHTGDLGRLDDNGSVVITGRLKDVIIRHGENISAKEIEDLLHTHPAVADVAVVGLPDERTGERVCAVVVAEGEAEVSLDDLCAHLREAGIMTQKLPEQLVVVDALPRNDMGKVLKQQLRRDLG